MCGCQHCWCIFLSIKVHTGNCFMTSDLKYVSLHKQYCDIGQIIVKNGIQCKVLHIILKWQISVKNGIQCKVSHTILKWNLVFFYWEFRSTCEGCYKTKIVFKSYYVYDIHLLYICIFSRIMSTYNIWFCLWYCISDLPCHAWL